MGQMVYVYEKGGRELARFTLAGAEFAAISPKGDVFAVKTKNGCVALYSLETLSQLSVLKEQDCESEFEKGMCFSTDGDMLFNAEKNAVSVYDMNGGESEKHELGGAEISHIEYDGGMFLLGKENEKFFVSKLENGELSDVKYITEKAFKTCSDYKSAQIRGYSSAAVEHYLPDICNVENEKASLRALWEKEV